MKIPVITIIAALALLITAAEGQGEPKTISKEMALDAINLYCADPLSTVADGAAAIVLKFVDTSPDVVIKITEKTCPWFKNKAMPVKYSAKLLGAYAVGNTKSQLTSGRAKNDSYAGVLQVINTYHRMQKREPKLKLPEVEHLVDLEKQRKLQEYLATS